MIYGNFDFTLISAIAGIRVKFYFGGENTPALRALGPEIEAAKRTCPEGDTPPMEGS